MKKIIFLLAFIVLAGCSKPSANERPISEVISVIKGEINMEESMEEDLSDQKNAEKYGISTNSITDGIAYYSTAEGKSDKVILVRASSQEEVENIEQALSSELTASTAAWENNEEESKKIEKGLLKTKDDCVILAISDEVDKIEKIFDESL